MLFTEGRFLVFLVVVWSVHWLLRSDRWRKLWLLAASYLFYGAWDWRFLSLILISTGIDFFVGRRLAVEEDPGRRRRFLLLSLTGNLGLLGFFKYFNFFVGSAAHALGGIGMEVGTPALEIVLPVGISFYTFQTLSYTIDVYRRKLAPVSSLLDFALFVAFFPQLVAGPIVRAAHFLPQLTVSRRLGHVRFRACAVLFFLGFVKKACLGDHVAVPVDAVFANPELYGAIDKWLAMGLYTIQIYCDFSGYSDMAIAVAGIFGYQLPLNFDFPYLAGSVTSFWRRWHVTLSSWFRDYLYIPLGGSRAGPGPTYRNLVLVFLLCGLWHGANWTFVVWGLIHGVVLLLERMGLSRVLESLPRAVRVTYVVAVALLGWVFFRAPDVASGGRFMADMFTGTPAAGAALWAGWWAVLGGFAVVHWMNSRDLLLGWMRRVPPMVLAPVLGLAVALALPWVVVGYKPFIYFQF